MRTMTVKRHGVTVGSLHRHFFKAVTGVPETRMTRLAA